MSSNSICTGNANGPPGTDSSEVKSARTRAVQIEEPVTEIDTQKVLTDPPRKPTKKAARGMVFFLVAAAALFIGIAAFGSYTRNQSTTAVQRATDE
jgi:hypothetical protein